MHRRTFIGRVFLLPLIGLAPAVFGGSRRSEAKRIAEDMLESVERDQQLQRCLLGKPAELSICVGEWYHYDRVKAYRLAVCPRYNPGLNRCDASAFLPPSGDSLSVLEDAAGIVSDRLGCGTLFLPSGPDDHIFDRLPRPWWIVSGRSVVPPDVTLPFRRFHPEGGSGWLMHDGYVDSRSGWFASFPLDYYIGTAEQARRLARMVANVYGLKAAVEDV